MRQVLRILLLVMILTSLGFSQSAIDVSPPLVVDLDDPVGTNITVPILVSISSGGVSIDAYILDFIYPTSVLSFVSTDNAGTLTDGWFSSTGQENTPGTITIGGFDSTNPITETGTDTLINVIFQIIDSGTGFLQLRNFGDDIADATTTDGTLNSTLPVELASFSAQVFENGVKLNWLTLSETDNFGFDVERSDDKELFSKIGFVPGHGTTNIEQRYEFTDETISVGTFYYRLKQIDTDGKFDYSSVLEAVVGTPKSFSLAQNYPNPFNPETSIQFELPQQSRVQIVVFNQRGRLIRNLIDNSFTAGTHAVTWNGKDGSGREVASGVYLYKIVSGDFVQTRKMILLR